MNFRLILRLLGLVLLIVSGAIVLVGLWGLTLDADKERLSAIALLLAGGIGAVVGGAAGWFFRKRHEPLLRREAILLVVFTWVLGAAVSALPYYIWAHLVTPGSAATEAHPFHLYVNCYFEGMSGLTTSGSTVLTDIDSMPHGILLWRSATHWLGGLGIVVLFVAVLSTLGVSGKRIFELESSLQSHQGVHPRIRDTARVLYLAYIILTLAQIILMRIAGLNWFESICESFGTIATGGFSVHNQSIATYRSPMAEVVVIVFMVLGGLNFMLYYQLWQGRWRNVWRDSELRSFLVVLLIGGGLVTIVMATDSIFPLSGGEVDPTSLHGLRYAFFNYTSLQTDTGFATADFTYWPSMARVIIMGAALIGGCTGSTTGGIKIFRFVSAARILWSRMMAYVLPKKIKPVRFNRRTLDYEDQTGVVIMVAMFLVALCLGTLLVVEFEPDGPATVGTHLTACIATLCTAGPGLGKVGPAGNFAFYTIPSKIVMCTLMLIGRLEVLPVLALMTPRFWQMQ